MAHLKRLSRQHIILDLIDQNSYEDTSADNERRVIGFYPRSPMYSRIPAFKKDPIRIVGTDLNIIHGFLHRKEPLVYQTAEMKKLHKDACAITEAGRLELESLATLGGAAKMKPLAKGDLEVAVQMPAAEHVEVYEVYRRMGKGVVSFNDFLRISILASARLFDAGGFPGKDTYSDEAFDQVVYPKK